MLGILDLGLEDPALLVCENGTELPGPLGREDHSGIAKRWAHVEALVVAGDERAGLSDLVDVGQQHEMNCLLRLRQLGGAHRRETKKPTPRRGLLESALGELFHP